MKIAINTLPLQSGHRTRGIGFYTKNLLEHLKGREDIEVQEFSDINEVKDADLVHYPYFDLFQRSLPLIKRFPTVVTIHDVTPLVFPKIYPPGIRGSINNLWQRLALKNVRAIMTDSKSSKQDLVKYLGIKEDIVFPVYLAAASHFKPVRDYDLLSLDKRRVSDSLKKVKNKYNLPDIFALFVGSVNWNKNLVNLTQACLNANVDIVLVGKDFENKDNLNHPEKRSYAEFLQKFEKNPQVHILGFIGDEELVNILNLSKVLLLPSFYEGFGLPILEGQKAGVPVITGNISSMPEIAGGGALLVDPDDVDEISNALSSLITAHQSLTIRDSLIQKGFENVKRFSWEKTTDETLKVFSKVLKEIKGK